MMLNISSSSLGVYFPTSYSTIVYPQLLKFLRLFNKWIIIYLNDFMPPSSARISFNAQIAFWITNGSGSLIILYRLSIMSLSFEEKKQIDVYFLFFFWGSYVPFVGEYLKCCFTFDRFRIHVEHFNASNYGCFSDIRINILKRFSDGWQ